MIHNFLFVRCALIALLVLPAGAWLHATDVPERPDPRRNVLKFPVLPALFGTYGLQYERMVGESASLTLGGDYTYIERGYSLRGLSFHADIKGYLNYWRHVPEGFYLSAFTNVRGYDFSYYEDTDQKEKILERTGNLGLGLGTGNQWLLFNNRLALDLSLGFGYFFRRQTVSRIRDQLDIQSDENGSVITVIESSSIIPDGFRFQLGLAAGWAF